MSNQEPKSEAFFKEGESPKDSSPYIEINKPKEKKDETPENIDQIAFDKNNWNLDNIQIPDLSLKKQSESKLSIDAADMSNQRLKELLNEDLINAIDSSPMLTPKNMIKDATIENNNDNSNNENVVENSEDFNENELFQFSLYNNKSEKDEETNESNIIKTDEINKIKEDEGGGDLNLNNLNNNNIDIAPQIPNDNIINKEENKIIEPQKIEENKDKENKIESKDKSGIDSFLDSSFVLIHMSGNQEPKNQFINDVMGGVLNYYHSKIINPQIKINNNNAEMNVDVNLDAKVYGMKGNWTLHSHNTFQKKNGKWYFVRWGN